MKRPYEEITAEINAVKELQIDNFNELKIVANAADQIRTLKNRTAYNALRAIEEDLLKKHDAYKEQIRELTKEYYVQA